MKLLNSKIEIHNAVYYKLINKHFGTYNTWWIKMIKICFPYFFVENSNDELISFDVVQINFDVVLLAEIMLDYGW
jgi:hypothetical protein